MNAERHPLVLLVGLLLAACTSASPSQPVSQTPASAASVAASPSPTLPSDAGPSETPASTSASVAPGGEPTDNLNPFACGEPVTGIGNAARAQITDVRVGIHEGYDRVVFAFADGIPPFEVAPATPPFTQDASGLPINVSGTSFLRIRLDGGTKISPEGGLTYSGSTDFQPTYPALVQLVEGGDFEAVSTWYVGLASADACFRVFTLADTPRIVIDLRH